MKILNTNFNENLIIDASKTLKEGTIIKARIAEINGEKVIIILDNGELLEAKTDLNMEKMKNQLLSFLVKNIENDKIILMPIDQEDVAIIKDGGKISDNNIDVFIDKVLDSYNITKSEENKLIIKTMLSFKMPLTKENVTDIIKNADKLEELTNLHQEDKVFVLDSEKNPLYESIKKLVKTNVSNELTRNIRENELIHNNAGNQSKNDTEQVKTHSNMNPKDVTEIIYPKLKTLFPEHTTYLKLTNKVVFLAKLGMDISLENIQRLTNLIDEGKGMIKPLLELLVYMNDNLENNNNFLERNFDLFNKVDFKLIQINKDNTINKENVKKYLNNINDIIEQIKSSITTKKNLAGELNIKLNNLFDSIELYNKVNSYYTFIHIPIEFNGETEDNNLFILKKNNKPKTQSFSFYISLNTKYLRKVDVFCNIYKERIKIDFIVGKKFSTIFNSNFEYLRESLDSLGYKNILINLKDNKENDVINIFLENESLNYNLDVRV